MLTDPNSFIRAHVQPQDVIQFFEISIAAPATAPIVGGGTNGIAFLLGNPAASPPSPANAQVTAMSATFWIETVQYQLEIPVFLPGQPPLVLPAPGGILGQPVTEFLVDPPLALAITTPRVVTVTSTQIQYSQTVTLVFNNGITWPHVSVATLVPSTPVPIAASAWAQGG
jgi:hypothetical protein